MGCVLITDTCLAAQPADIHSRCLAAPTAAIAYSCFAATTTACNLQVLPGCGLRSLALSANELGDEGALALATVLACEYGTRRKFALGGVL